MATKAKKRADRLSLKDIDDRSAVTGFLVFLVIVIFLFDALANQQALASSKTAPNSNPLTKQVAETVASKLIVNSRDQGGLGFVVKDIVDSKMLDYFTSLDYEQIKAYLGIDGDFVINFEDQNGNVVPMGSKLCVGSKDAQISGVPCG